MRNFFSLLSNRLRRFAPTKSAHRVYDFAKPQHPVNRGRCAPVSVGRRGSRPAASRPSLLFAAGTRPAPPPGRGVGPHGDPKAGRSHPEGTPSAASPPARRRVVPPALGGPLCRSSGGISIAFRQHRARAIVGKRVLCHPKLGDVLAAIPWIPPPWRRWSPGHRSGGGPVRPSPSGPNLRAGWRDCAGDAGGGPRAPSQN